MDMKNAPTSLRDVVSGETIAKRLEVLIGKKFNLTLKARTDGSNLRKIITEELSKLVESTACNDDYKILPPKGKGIPKLLAVLADTYIVTSGQSYNLQVWNRIPNSASPLITYKNGESISSKDIRLILVKINLLNHTIDSIITMTPDYIENTFGVFGKQTIKHQLLVSSIERDNIVNSSGLYFNTDTEKISSQSLKTYVKPLSSSDDKPVITKLLSIEVIRDLVVSKLIGRKLENSDTKTRGQLLERIVIELLGYSSESKLVGGYPDIPNQLLEVKVQDTQTIDLGKYTPQYEQQTAYDEFTTYDVRYLIALTNPLTGIIEGVILSNGKSLGEKFTYVSAESYKCQRAIPMSFFEQYSGQSLFNP